MHASSIGATSTGMATGRGSREMPMVNMSAPGHHVPGLPRRTLSVALRRRMSDTDSDGISTLTRRISLQGSLCTSNIVSSACRKSSNV